MCAVVYLKVEHVTSPSIRFLWMIFTMARPPGLQYREMSSVRSARALGEKRYVSSLTLEYAVSLKARVIPLIVV